MIDISTLKHGYDFINAQFGYFDKGADFLMHHGILGMRWGHHKAKEEEEGDNHVQ